MNLRQDVRHMQAFLTNGRVSDWIELALQRKKLLQLLYRYSAATQSHQIVLDDPGATIMLITKAVETTILFSLF